MEHIETFGEALSRFMQAKDCTIKELTALMGIKSSTTITRILANKSSSRKIQLFCDEFLLKNPLELVADEKKELREALTVSIMGVEAFSANRQMISFVRERSAVPDYVCKQAFGDDCLFIVTLDDLFLSYLEYERVDIMLQNCALSGVTKALKTLLEQHKNTVINIEHYVSTNEDRVKIIDDFTSLLDVTGHPDYHFFFSSICGYTGDRGFNAYGHVLVAMKCDKDGNKWTDIVRFTTEDGFELLHNAPGDACYQFNMRQFHSLRAQHNPAKATFSSDLSFHGMLSYSDRLLQMDLKYSCLVIRPDVCLCMIPPEICQAVSESARSNQNEVSDTVYKKYIQVVTRRFQLFCSSKKRHTFLFSRAGMVNFYKTGKSRANVFGLRDLTLEERRQVIAGVIKVARTIPTTKIYLLKNELHYNNISYFLYDDKTLFIDSYQNFSNFDPSTGFHSCCMHNPDITQSFAYFAEHDLIEQYTHSTEETLEFLEELLQM